MKYCHTSLVSYVGNLCFIKVFNHGKRVVDTGVMRPSTDRVSLVVCVVHGAVCWFDSDGNAFCRDDQMIIWFWQINDYAKLMICYFKLCIGLSRSIRNIYKKKKWLYAIKFYFSLITFPTKTDFWVKNVVFFFLSMHLNPEYNIFDLFVVGKSYEK